MFRVSRDISRPPQCLVFSRCMIFVLQFVGVRAAEAPHRRLGNSAVPYGE